MKEYAHILRAIANGDPIQWINESCHWEPIKPFSALGKISTNGDALAYAPERFRVAPRTININGHEVPEPLRIPPEFGADYFRPVLLANGCLAETCRWQRNIGDLIAFNRGMCHATQDAAEAHALALLSFTEQKP